MNTTVSLELQTGQLGELEGSSATRYLPQIHFSLDLLIGVHLIFKLLHGSATIAEEM
jgi:hypothetical protein